MCSVSSWRRRTSTVRHRCGCDASQSARITSAGGAVSEKKRWRVAAGDRRSTKRCNASASRRLRDPQQGRGSIAQDGVSRVGPSSRSGGMWRGGLRCAIRNALIRWRLATGELPAGIERLRVVCNH